jgi:hypothetical protein
VAQLCAGLTRPGFQMKALWSGPKAGFDPFPGVTAWARFSLLLPLLLTNGGRDCLPRVWSLPVPDPGPAPSPSNATDQMNMIWRDPRFRSLVCVAHRIREAAFEPPADVAFRDSGWDPRCPSLLYRLRGLEDDPDSV